MASRMPRVRFQRDEKSNCQKKKCGRVKMRNITLQPCTIPWKDTSRVLE